MGQIVCTGQPRTGVGPRMCFSFALCVVDATLASTGGSMMLAGKEAMLATLTLRLGVAHGNSHATQLHGIEAVKTVGFRFVFVF